MIKSSMENMRSERFIREKFKEDFLNDRPE